MEKIKVIFLDIDGVLNDAHSLKETFMDAPTQAHMDCLAKIIKETDAKIVLSSSWREYPELITLLNECFATFNAQIFDVTPISRVYDRGIEIKMWLDNHPEVENFVILDDDDFDIMDMFKDNFVHTTFAFGLLPTHAKQAIKILNERKN